jgi:hypothetical protein
MTTLPPELWLIILDMVVEENVVGSWQCDRATFPFMRKSLHNGTDLYRLRDLHRRLRLVCRSFNAMVGSNPMHYFSPLASFPFPNTTRALVLHLAAVPATPFQRLLAETSTCRQLVCLEVTCSLNPISDWPSASSFLRASVGRVLPNVQRLVLRLANHLTPGDEQPLWSPLNHAFPLLVTLVISLERVLGDGLLPVGLMDEDVTLERLEILYLGGAIPYWGLNLPRLRYASIATCSKLAGANLKRSPHLDSLFVRNPWIPMSLDVGSYSHLRLLGLDEVHLARTNLVLLDDDHPLEHFWLFMAGKPRGEGRYWPFDWILERLPRISRITIDFLLVDVEALRRRTEEFRRMKLAYIGLSIMQPVHDSRILDIERVANVTADDGILSKVWRMMRR